jgi:hypothetical protein
MKEKTEYSVFGRVGELSAAFVHGEEDIQREREMEKGKCPGHKPLRRTFSEGCRGEVENDPCPD